MQLAPDATVVVDATGRIRLVNHLTEKLFGYSAEELVTQPVELLVPERFREVHERYRAQYAAAPYVLPFGGGLSLTGRRRDGSEFPIEVSLGPLDSGGESLVIVSIHDISELQWVHDAHVATQAANQDLHALQALTDIALSHLALEDLLPALLERVINVLGTDNAAVLLLDAEGQTLTMEAGARIDVPLSTPVQVPVGQGVAGRIAATREPVVVDDVATYPVAVPLFRDKFHSLAGVPLEVGDQLLGVVLVGTALPRHFTPRDVQLLQQAADRMALAIDRAHLYRREQEAREQAETALAQAQVSERRYQRLVDANIIGVAVTDTERVLEANDAFLQLVGYTQADVQAGRLRRDTLTTTETHSLARQTADEAVTTGASAPFEREYVRKDGSRVPVLVGPVLLQSDPLRLVNFVLDLSERKQLEHTLAERVARLEAVMEAVPDALAVYDTNGTILQRNAAADAQAARFTPEKVLGETVTQLYQQAGGAHDVEGKPLQPEALPMSRALRGEVLAGSDAVIVAMDSPTGGPVYYSVTGSPLRDIDGSITGATTLARDITERKRLERALAERVAQLEAVMEAVPYALAVYDSTGRVILANGVYQAHVPPGKTIAERIKHIGGVFDEHGAQLEEAQWPQNRALKGEILAGTNALELTLLTPQGETVYSRVTAAPLRDQSGTIVGAVTLNQNITDQKRLEQEREAAHARELAAQEAAKQLNAFLAMAAHDIRTPVTVISGQVQLALHRAQRLATALTAAEAPTPAADAVVESLDMAWSGVKRLRRLVEHLFDIAQAQTGTLALKLAPCDLTALVCGQVAAQQDTIPERRIVLQVPAEDVHVEADADRLDQVLGNYLSNALKYSPANQPVTVRLEVEDHFAVVSVVDCGPGLPPEEQSRVWELFHRVPGIEVQSESSESSGSLGLGLHICKQLVELHPGGRVGVDSIMGTGSTFWFRLPLAT
jgi:PAS domain S-box-containing protein